jgi:hypothetical protein
MRLIPKGILAVLALLFCQVLSAAGGACPASASYLNTANPAGPLVTLSSLGITSCYYIAASGSDSNNGTSESTPWLHVPGMPNCTNTCNSVTPAAGEGFIFRGGDTWHFGNSGASPYTGGEWQWNNWDGSSASNMLYVGVDQTWYSGTSWSRPILTGDNPTRTSAVSSCAYTIPTGSFNQTNSLLVLGGLKYTIFDNFELTGMCWNSSSGGAQYVYSSGSASGFNSPYYIENLYIHGWTHTSSAPQGGNNGGHALFGYNQNFGVVYQFNVIDGSDSDDNSLSAFGESVDTYILQYNVIRHTSGSNISLTCHIIHDNLFEYFTNVTDGSTHSDLFWCENEAGASEFWAGDGTPNLFYNNIIRYIGTEYLTAISDVVTMTPPSASAYYGGTDYVFNNVFHDYYLGSGTNYNDWCENDAGCSRTALFNNTMVAGLPNYTGCIMCDQSGGTPVTSVNNDWITNAGSTPGAVIANNGSGVTESSAVYMTPAQASTQGYTSANDFAPTSSSGSTVSASGTNETSNYCAALSNSLAETACVNGITGVSYNSTNHTVVYPAFPAVARAPSGSWNAGAYQFSSGNVSPLSPATNLSANVH